jgi:hypothetical protein
MNEVQNCDSHENIYFGQLGFFTTQVVTYYHRIRMFVTVKHNVAFEFWFLKL